MREMTFTILAIVALLSGFMLFTYITSETPNERVERINRNADRECGEYEEVMARNCYAWYYQAIENRD